MTIHLTEQQAFNAMRRFLDCYYKKTMSDDIGSLLGSLQLHGDKLTWDPAAWGEWFECLERVADNTEKISPLLAFNTMTCYLKFYSDSTRSDDIPILLAELHPMPNGSIRNPTYWDIWIDCVQETPKE